MDRTRHTLATSSHVPDHVAKPIGMRLPLEKGLASPALGFGCFRRWSNCTMPTGWFSVWTGEPCKGGGGCVPRYSACQNVPLAVVSGVGLCSALALGSSSARSPPPPFPSYPGGVWGVPWRFYVPPVVSIVGPSGCVAPRGPFVWWT